MYVYHSYIYIYMNDIHIYIYRYTVYTQGPGLLIKAYSASPCLSDPTISGSASQ